MIPNTTESNVSTNGTPANVYRLALGYPVSVNKMYQRGRDGSVILTKAAAEWKELAGWSAIAQVGRVMLAGDVSVTVHFHARPRADSDNILKLTLDSQNGILWEDDEQITELHVYKYRNAENPRIELEIRGLKDE